MHCFLVSGELCLPCLLALPTLEVRQGLCEVLFALNMYKGVDRYVLLKFQKFDTLF